MEYKELVLLDLDDFVENQEKEKIDFVINSPELADWAIEKIKEENARCELFKQAIESKIEVLKDQQKKEEDKLNGKTSWLRFKLNEYLNMENVPAKKNKNSITLKLPSGSIVRKLPKLDYCPITEGIKNITDDNQLIDFYKIHNPEYIATTCKVKWGELKKDISIINCEVVDKETGEVTTQQVVVDKKGNVIPIGITETPMQIEIK